MAKDLFHDCVKDALIKDEWSITDDPYELRVGGVEMYIDLAAEAIIAAQKEDIKIAVEVKCFAGASNISEFHTAHGQFLDYRYALEEEESDRVLYLAVPRNVYQSFFSLQFIQRVIQRSQISLVIYDPEEVRIVQWIK
jgi:XisH protein